MGVAVARSQAERRARRTALLYVLPSLVCLAAVILHPLAMAVLTSLYRWNLISGRKIWHGFQNYLDIVTDPETWRVAMTTVTYTGTAVALEFVAGFALALVFRAGLARRLRAFSMLRVVISIPILIAPLIWAFYFRSLYSPQFGAFNLLLGQLGLGPIPWVNDPHLALLALIVADAWQWTPFMFAVILAGMMALPGEVAEAARIDGAGPAQILWHVELPLLRPVLLVALLLRLIDSIKNLDLVLVITQGGPGTSTEILNFFAYRVTFQAFQVGRGAALAIIVFLVILLMVLALLRILRERDASGAAA